MRRGANTTSPSTRNIRLPAHFVRVDDEQDRQIKINIDRCRFFKEPLNTLITRGQSEKYPFHEYKSSTPYKSASRRNTMHPNRTNANANSLILEYELFCEIYLQIRTAYRIFRAHQRHPLFSDLCAVDCSFSRSSGSIYRNRHENAAPPIRDILLKKTVRRCVARQANNQ